MITLQPIFEENLLEALRLRVLPEQQDFVASATGILARAYGYRRDRAKAWGICEGDQMIGLAMIHDLNEEPACYHLAELMIDCRFQGMGYGRQALALLLAHCQRERKYNAVEVCVKRKNAAAIHLYEQAGFRDTGYVDPEAPDSRILSYLLRPKRSVPLDIHLTGVEDLAGVQRLWADPDVMRYVDGFSDGLHVAMEHLEKEWLPWVQQPPLRQHVSVYENGCYCGESFYSVDETGLASMDIKLLPAARGKGIARAALSYALDAAFQTGKAVRAYVDPSPANEKALQLYAGFGFRETVRPSHLDDPGCPYVYLELTCRDWELRRADGIL